VIRRRTFIAGLGAAAAWPLAARAQQTARPVVGVINTTSERVAFGAAFAKGLRETGFIDGGNVTVEHHWMAGQIERTPEVAADLVRRRVAVIATPGSTVGALAAKAATSSIPIVFGVGDDPVRLGLVSSIPRPEGNVTGINFFAQEATAKRLRLLHDLLPKAVQIAVLVNPTNGPVTEATLRDLRDAAPALGMQIHVLEAAVAKEVESAFAALARDRADALFIAADGFFVGRVEDLAARAAQIRIPASYAGSETVQAGGLMSYGSSAVEMYRQVGVYTGTILKGTKPGDLPVLQSTKFEFALNLKTAKALGIEIPPSLLAIADAVIE
jgi:putative tryptophan/tyrosine transport system substrate-binding protein